MAKLINIDEENELALELLGDLFQSANINLLLGSGASLPAVPLAGDLESDLNKLISANAQEEANLALLDFIVAIEEQNRGMQRGDLSDEVTESIDQYKSLIAAIDQILFARKSELIPKQANVFTTNYDLLFELAASRVKTVSLNDGFDRSSNVLGDHFLSPELYFDRMYRSGVVNDRAAEVPVINLIKLHGSFSWKRTGGKIAELKRGRKPWDPAKRDDSSAVEKFLRWYCLVLPNLRKFHTTLLDRTYYDLMRIYANSFDRENALFASFGFSFADKHILDITKRGLRNPTSMLALFSYDDDSTESFLSDFDSDRNVLIFHREKKQEFNFDEVNRLLASVPPKMSEP